MSSGIVNRRTGTGYLVRTCQYVLRTYRYVLVQNINNSTDQYIPFKLRTEYVPESQCHVCWIPLGALIQCWSTTTYMPSTHSIVSHMHTTSNSIPCNYFVNTVHPGMYQVRTKYVLRKNSTYQVRTSGTNWGKVCTSVYRYILIQIRLILHFQSGTLATLTSLLPTLV